MGLKRNIFTFAFVFFLLSSFAIAASFDVTLEPIKERIVVNEFAKYKIAIRNNLDVKDEYRIYTLDFPTWGVRTDPITNPITLEAAPGQEDSVEIIIDPLKIKEIGSYQVNLNVRSRVLDSAISVPLKVTILSTDTLIQGYVPTVLVSVGIPENVDPRKDIPIKIVLNNQNVINYSSLEIKIESNLIRDSTKAELGPKEEKTLEITKTIEPLTRPQEDRLVVTVFAGERAISSVTKGIHVIQYAGKELIKEENKFLIKKSTYRFMTNNDAYEGTLKIETNLVDSIFSSTQPRAQIVRESGSKRHFAWNVVLENDEMVVTVTRNFIPLIVAIVLIIAAIAGYFFFRSSLVMVKEVTNLVKSDGGISEMTVVLHLSNRGQNKIKQIEVSDYVPGLVGIESDIPIGSLQPTKVLRHEKRGTTIVKWTIELLDPAEERVLSYRIKSKLPILGSFTLPTAKATFMDKGKVYISSSNRLSITA